MTISGNTKTRDNVIRRELLVHDSELFHGTNLLKSKNNINRLGFFEEVQVLEERDPELENVLNLSVRVKETNTGQLQAAIGYTPKGSSDASVFGQGKYDEKNQSGKGWGTSFSGKFTDESNYKLTLGFSDPRVNDSHYSLGLNGSYEEREVNYSRDVRFSETRQSASVTVGRKIIELLRGSVSLVRSKTIQSDNEFALSDFRSDGIRSSLILGLSRRSLNNYLDPTSGSSVSLSHKFTGGILGGDYQFMETSLGSSFYIPIDFTPSFRTYFKLYSKLGLLWESGDKKIPFVDRYRLGGFNDLRGYDYGSIGPTYRILDAPGGQARDYPRGGNKQLYFQFEYFVPLIPEAKIKALAFADAGRAFDDDEAIELKDFKSDVGFGLRWITPIAPFRFEWAFPVKEDGSLGDAVAIFNIGY
jgi:outer membrane protein insertion porin family